MIFSFSLPAAMETKNSTIQQLQVQLSAERHQNLEKQAQLEKVKQELELAIVVSKSESALLESESFFQHIVNTTPNALYIYDLIEQRNIYANQAITSVLGYSKAEIQGMETLLIENLCHPDDRDRVVKHLAKCAYLEDGEILELECRIKNYRGEWRWLRSRDTVFARTKDGKPQHILATAEDITDRVQTNKEIQQELAQEKEINRLKSNFILMLCHDLRTSLTTILASSKLIESIDCKPSMKERMFVLLNQGIQQANQLLSDALIVGITEFGKIELNPTSFDLGKFISLLVEELEVNHGGRKNLIVCGRIDENIIVRLDRKLLKQILINLLNNAIKYSPNHTPIYLRFGSFQEQIFFQVEDRGIGIPEDDKKHLFDYLRRGSNVRGISGTGLGLAIVKQCVELQKGTIAYESEVGRGTTFTVTLPKEI